jgi:HEAT repeat protein
MFATSVILDLGALDPSSVILGSLLGLIVLAILLYFSGALGFLIGLVGTVLGAGITGGFAVWRRLFSWAPWPVFLGLTLGLLALGLHLGNTIPALAALVAVVPLLMGMTACLAYMYIDWERYDVARGYKSVHNPLKGQELAHRLVRYGHRVGVMLLAVSALAVVGGFALLNQGLGRSIGSGWYDLGSLSGEFADYLAYALINLYGVVDVLDLARHRHLLTVEHIQAAAWPAATLLMIYKTFFTFVLLQQLFASVRNAKLLGETIDDFWSPYQPIHLRARGSLPLYGLAAIGPLLSSLRSRGALTQEQREQLPGILADMGPAIAPVLTAHVRDPHADVRAVAVAALGRLRALAALPRLLRRSEDPSPVVRQSLVEALGLLGAPASAVACQNKRAVAVRRGRLRLWMRVWWWWAQRLRQDDPLAAVVAGLRHRLADVAPRVRLCAAQALGAIGPQARAAAEDLRWLTEQGDDTIRCAAAEALGHVGIADEATRTTLISLLADGSPALRRAAAQGLGLLREPAAAAIPALVQALQDSDDAVRQAAAEAIAAIGTVPEAAMDTLVGGLASPDNVVRAHTARALGEIGSAAAEAAPALVEALADTNDTVRAEVVGALGKLGPAAAEVAVPRIVHALHDPDSWVSALAAEALGAMGESAEEAVPALVRSLGHINIQVRANAAEALGKLGPAAESARPALVRAAVDDDGSVRSQAVRALGLFGPDFAARPTLRAALRDPDPRVRAAGAEAVAEWHEQDEVVKAELIRLLDDPSDLVKVQAAQTLPRLGTANAEAVNRLCKRLQKDDNVWVLGQFAQALGRLGSVAQAAGPALVQAAQTAEASVREQALHALTLIQPPDAAAAFLAGLKDANADIRRMASAGLRRAQAIPDESMDMVVEALRDPDVAVRTNVACALGRLEPVPEAAVPLLLEATAHPSDGLRLHAAQALQSVPDKHVVATLEGLLADPNMSVRLIAARALLATPPLRPAALTVVEHALAHPAPGFRRAALRLIENRKDDADGLLAALKQQATLETEEALRYDMARLLAGLEDAAARATVPALAEPVTA